MGYVYNGTKRDRTKSHFQGSKAMPPARIERDSKIREMRRSGMSYADIGRALKLTGERVRQIAKEA